LLGFSKLKEPEMKVRISLLVILTILLSASFPGIVFGDDPGEPDTCRVHCLDVTLPNQQVVVEVSVYNDEELGGVAVPLMFGNPGLDVACDSVSFVGTRVEHAEYKGSSIDSLNYKLVFYAIFIDSSLIIGDGTVAYLYFTTGPNWDSTLCMHIDTALYPPTNILEFTPRETGQALYPQFQKGCLGSGVVPTPELISPADQANVCSPDTHQLVWSKSGEDIIYTLEYAEDSNFTLGVVSITDLEDTSYSVELSRHTYWWRVKATNPCGKDSPYQDPPHSFYVYASGDATNDGVVDAADVVYIINYLFRGQNPPDPLESGDASCDGKVDASDVVWLVGYLFREGLPPCCP
jgi:hypothetical protein